MDASSCSTSPPSAPSLISAAPATAAAASPVGSGGAPTIVQLPPRTIKRATEAEPLPSLPTSIDRRVFDELPLKIQREILAEHAQQQAAGEMDASRTSSRSSSGEGEGETTLRGPHAAVGDDDDDELYHPRRASEQDAGWICRVCTFVNHPELDECEICETLRVDDDDSFDEQRRGLEQPSSGSARSVSSPVSAKLSAVSRSLRRIRLPATPTATALTNSSEPTADDLLIAATSKIYQLQQSASKGLLSAKDALLGGKSARTSGSNSPSGTRQPRGGSTDSSDGKARAAMALPSSQASLELTVLQYDLNQKCEPGSELFEGGLERLWHAVYSERASPRPFVREGEGWIDMGFQRVNPETDFRGGGMLALKCLLYAFEAHPREMSAIVDAQKPPKAGTAKKWYPVCVAGINVTCMIAGLLKLGNGKFEDTPEAFWPLFEEPAAFYQLFFHAFVKMDATWRRMNASYMEFGVVLKATRQMVAHMLAQTPRSLDELRAAADRTFVDGFVVCLSSRFLADSENGECPDPYNALEDETEIILTATRATDKGKGRASAAAGSVWPLR